MPFPIIVRARPPAGRARPSPLHIKKALASKWYLSRNWIFFSTFVSCGSLEYRRLLKPR